MKCAEFLFMTTLRDHVSVTGFCTSSNVLEPACTKNQKVIAMFNLVIAVSFLVIAMY